MKIKRFVGTAVNRHLTFDIHFFDELTFVTGINGSGKTSVLNSIAALLLPRLDYLASAFFELISIDIQHEENLVALSAHKDRAATILTCSQFPDEKFRIVEFDPPEPMSPSRVREYEDEYYSELLAKSSENPIVDFIQSLPTPMYLGLDRRSLSFEGERRYGPRAIGRSRARNIFGRSRENGLLEALHFAREHIHEVRRRENTLDAKFREKVVLALINFPPISIAGKFERPSQTELRKYEEAKKNMSRLPAILNIDKEIVMDKIGPSIQFLDKTLQRIRKSKGKIPDRELALFEWSFNKTNIDKLSTLSEIISEYNNDVSSVRKRINDYLHTINRFMCDSGKKIIFNNVGELQFTLDSDVDTIGRPIHTLSSGEIQLIVILTQLYFNPEVARANVFIIDEPELSLHVQWQEMFVVGITEASSETQFILATHSPAIILDRTKSCRDLTQS